MKLRLDIAGGIAAPLMSRQLVVDSATLPEAQQRQLETLVEQALSEPPREVNPRLRDAMSYELTVVSDRGEQTIVAYDGSVSRVLRELIELLKSVASKSKA